MLALPASILSIIAASNVYAQEQRWPYNLPRNVKYHPEDEALVRRHEEIQGRLASQLPMGVNKMSSDAGQKFFLDYWDLDPIRRLDDGARGEEVALGSNSSISQCLRPAIAPHTNHDRTGFRLLRRAIFARDFECPTDTHSCSSAGEADLCCNTGETCVTTSEGVGCCPAGQACGDEISECTGGYTSCPNSPNGGCCIPGASCEGTGCVFYGTETITTTLPLETDTSGLTTQTSDGVTVTIAVPTISVSEYTTTVTASPSGYATTRTITIGSTCSDDYFSCPASLGGGCCPTGQACAIDEECPDITSTVSPEPPVRQTSISISPADSGTATTTDTACPTGFYMCSARYLGGCCRVDRNCDTTSCPPADTATILNSGVTVVQSASTAIRGQSCANGWTLCGAGDGGGCCPSGYSCGVSSCSAAGQQDTAKIAPSSANVLRWAWSFLVLAFFAGFGMVVL